MNQPPKQVSLRFWGYWDSEVVMPLLKEFNASHPNISINYQKRELDRYRETLQSRIQNGSGPDVFYFQSRWLPMLSTQLSPLPESVMDPKTFQKTFVPVAYKDLSAYGKIWGLPTSFEGLGLLYNNELFKSVGLKTPPTNWDELRIKYLPLLTVRNKDRELQTAGIALGTGSNIDYSSDIIQLMMAQNGTTFLSGNELKINTSFANGDTSRNLGLDTLSFYNSFVSNKDYSTWSADFPPSTEAFINGRVAMIFATNRAIPEILKVSHQLGTPLELRVAPVPQLPASSEVTWGTTWSLGVSAFSPEQDSAWELIKFLSQKESVNKIIDNQKKLGVAIDIPARTESQEPLKTDVYLGTFVLQAKSATDFFGIEKTMDNGLNDAMSALFKEMGDSGSLSQKSFDDISAKMAKTLSDYRVIVLPEETK